MQYTVRKVPAALDKAIRGKARAEGKSLNEVAVEALAAQDRVDADLWK